MNRTTRTRQSPRWLAGWCVVVAVVIVSRPLQSLDLWWDLARGREVKTALTVHPSQNLLTLDHASDATWLGGSVLFEIWSVAGIFGLAAVPLVMAFLLRYGVVHSVSPASGALAAVVMVPLALLAARGDLEPTSALFDLICLGALWLILLHRGSTNRILWCLGVLFVVWANQGPRPLWGLLLVALWPGALWGRPAAIVVSLLAGMLTPRGALTWLDSATLFAPTAFVPSPVLEERWQSAVAGGWDASLVACGVLWIFAAVGIARRRSQRSIADWAVLAVPVVAVLLSRANVAPAALWTTFYWLTLTRSDDVPVTTTRPMWLRPVVALVTALVVVDSCGMLSPGSQAMGWGLSQGIDPRLLELADVIPGNDPAVAWAADSRSAGVAAWARTKTKLVDHPTRALLGGRSGLHAGVRRDLASAHRSRYRLDDGTWGGWGRTIAEWKVEVLFVPAEAADLHRGLLETPWKLMKLDSATVPYASAENPRFDRAVVDVILQQGFVEAGSWQPTIDVYDPRGWRVDVSNLLSLGPSAAPAIRQSRFFRAVKLPMAAVRAMGPVRVDGGTSAVREEFLQCQEALAWDEYTASGNVSLLRRLALDVPGIAESRSEPWRRTTWADWDKTDKHWRECLDHYRNGQARDAAEVLKGMTGDEAYARGMLLLEAGDVDLARTALESTLKEGPPAVKIAATHWLNQMSPAKKNSTSATRPAAIVGAFTREGR